MKKLHYIFEVGTPQSPAKPLQDYIVLNEIVADCRRWVLDDLGLVPALRWYLDQQAQRAGLRLRPSTTARFPQSSIHTHEKDQ
jgi:hypothetical protein